MFGSNGWAMAVTPEIRYFSRRRMSCPLILLSNDDGYQSVGLRRLHAALCEMADVVVCAPEFEQSAASHALSLHRPLRLKAHDAGVYSVDGTPADSVYVALFSGTRILPRAPDLVVSGLNHGVNLGDDVFYSGTVAAAREGALRGYRAMALSVADDASLDAAAELSVKLARRILERAGSEPLLCNINFPPGSQWPVAVTQLGQRLYNDEVEFRLDPRGREYLWLGGPPGTRHDALDGTDTAAFDAGVVGVTPLSLSLWSVKESKRTHAVIDGIV
jgi:5'-nucleotidase